VAIVNNGGMAAVGASHGKSGGMAAVGASRGKSGGMAAPHSKV